MRVKNTHRQISDDLVREVIRFVRPNGVANFDVVVKNSSGTMGGYCYWGGCSYHTSRPSAPLITIRVGEKSRFPYTEPVRPGTGYLSSVIYNQTEAVVHLLAHELRHLWQRDHSRGRVWGSRGRFSERDADAYAIHQVRAWRRAH